MEISLFTRSIMGIKFVLPEMCSTAALGCDPLSDQNAANAQPDCTPRVGVILNPRTKDRLEIIRGIRAGEGSAPLPSRGSQPCCLISLESRALSGERSHRSCSCTAALGCDPLSDQDAANAQPDCTPRVDVILSPRTKSRLEKIRGIRAGEGSAPLPSRGSRPYCHISLGSQALSGERNNLRCSSTAALGCAQTKICISHWSAD